MNAFNSVHFHSHSFTPISSSIHLKFHYADTRKIFVYVFVCVKAYEKHIIRIIFYRLWIVFCIVVAHFPPNLIQFKFIRNCFSVVFVFRSLCFTCISLSLSLSLKRSRGRKHHTFLVVAGVFVVVGNVRNKSKLNSNIYRWILRIFSFKIRFRD